MTEHKFEVGEMVWVPGNGWATLTKNPAADCNYPLEAAAHSYTTNGRECTSDKFPSLLTVEQAKAIGYEPPKEKRIIKGFLNVYSDCVTFWGTKEQADCNHAHGLIACVPCTSDEFEVES